MTHQAPPAAAVPAGDPGRQVASLREALRLAQAIAGGTPDLTDDAMLDEAARVSAAYARAAPIAQRRFDALAGEIAAWAAAGLEALLAAGETPNVGPARRLAEALEDGMRELGTLLSLN